QSLTPQDQAAVNISPRAGLDARQVVERLVHIASEDVNAMLIGREGQAVLLQLVSAMAELLFDLRDDLLIDGHDVRAVVHRGGNLNRVRLAGVFFLDPLVFDFFKRGPAPRLHQGRGGRGSWTERGPNMG